MTTIRAIALFVGAFGLLNVLGDVFRPGFDENLWWIDLRFLPVGMAEALLAMSAVALIAYAIRPAMTLGRAMITHALTAALLVFALLNVLMFYRLLLGGAFSTPLPVPLSLGTAVAMAAILYGMCKSELLTAERVIPRTAGVKNSPASWWRWAVVLAACCILFPLGQMYCFGKADYRRHADVIVVFGAGVYADGRPSDALVDRVRTGCDLYKHHLAATIIFSGGPGQGGVHETEAMRKLAIEQGVPPDAILLDPAGVNTQATAANVAAMLPRLGAKRVLAVSHFYHLPRVKLAFGRQNVEVFTVPAKESYFLREMPLYIAREVPGLWVYYLRPFIGEA